MIFHTDKLKRCWQYRSATTVTTCATEVYKNIIPAIDVVSRYAFVYPVYNPRAVNTTKVTIIIMTRAAYRPQ